MPLFQFKYMTNSCEVNIDDLSVNTKVGPFVKRNFPASNLMYFRYNQESNYHSMYLVYTDEKGKRRKITLMATPGEPGIQNLNYYLMEKFPQKGLNHLTEKEAFETMQVANPKKMAIWIILIMLNIIMGIALYPGLRHFFDFGFSKVQVEDIASGKNIGTRNVDVEGVLLSYGIEETTTHSKNGVTTGTSHTTFVPLVDENWQEGDPIKVLIEFKELTDDQYSAALDMTDFTGVIRNVAWEGVNKTQLGYFDEQYGIKFPETPVLIEYTNEEHNDIYAPCVLGGVNLIVIIIGLIIWLKGRK